LRTALSAAFTLISFAALAADYPAPKQGEWIAKDFKFHTGEVMPQLKLHYTTVGDPSGQPVLVLHGTGGSAASMLSAGFAGELFGSGQPLDAAKYYIIIPDGIGHVRGIGQIGLLVRIGGTVRAGAVLAALRAIVHCAGGASRLLHGAGLSLHRLR
jgi:hypothetical protein